MYNESFGSTAKRGFMGLPVAIRAIVGISTAIFLVQILGSIFLGQEFTLFVRNWFAFLPNTWVTLFQPWRLVTYMFLHAGFMHLLFNMLWLWWLGRSVEQTMGPRSFSVIYFGAGIGGALLDVALAQFFGINYVIGASGAVYGIMVAFAMLYPNQPIMLILLPPIPAKYLVAGLIAIDVLLVGQGDGVARVVHLGGAGVGYLLMKAYQRGTDLSKYVRPIERFWYRLAGTYEKSASRPQNKNMYSVSDANVVEEVEESELDAILEKISKKGYDALTKEEKKKLFELSNKN
ncbi:MAG: rhomboid family intramembrane serine protease [Balneolaceae bacterium]|nr:rhomboid family intramembrane serine protease [Balneolaceae bacterium]